MRHWHTQESAACRRLPRITSTEQIQSTIRDACASTRHARRINAPAHTGGPLRAIAANCPRKRVQKAPFPRGRAHCAVQRSAPAERAMLVGRDPVLRLRPSPAAETLIWFSMLCRASTPPGRQKGEKERCLRRLCICCVPARPGGLPASVRKRAATAAKLEAA